ncbi:MAG: M20/M25/M40 family metallo-hydrolase, partial [Chlamydiia bacterium]|nr:M20/M25/M40 family metallo-hydrolase [Chlamydiia bacterium]
VSARKGSANFSVVVHGRLAHAGRDFTSGRNAISALMDALLKIEALTDLDRGLTINIGAINGGGPVNVVPDLAIGRLNMRMEAMEDASATIDQIQEIVTETGRRDGIRAELIGALTRPPKPFDAATQKLFESIQSCGKDLGLDLTWRPTGGVCDGNILASAGLPTIDTLGVRGANIHTHDEFMLIDSLVERAQLTALFLMRLANGDCTLTQEILP